MPTFEEYDVGKVPFVLKKDLIRTPLFYTNDSNWHEDIELEYFKEGTGTVLLDGKEYFVRAGDFIFVKSNTIHHLIPQSNVKYSCLIVNRHFCQSVQFSQSVLPHFSCAELGELFLQTERIYENNDDPRMIMKLYDALFKQLILLNERYLSTEKESTINEALATKRTKKAVLYIRENFAEKLTLEKIANELFISKFLLSREFKKIMHTTIIEYINAYRCKVAAEKIRTGAAVSEAAFSCGYENMSYFTKTFKKYFHRLPSQLKIKE